MLQEYRKENGYYLVRRIWEITGTQIPLKVVHNYGSSTPSHVSTCFAKVTRLATTRSIDEMVSLDFSSFLHPMSMIIKDVKSFLTLNLHVDNPSTLNETPFIFTLLITQWGIFLLTHKQDVQIFYKPIRLSRHRNINRSPELLSSSRGRDFFWDEHPPLCRAEALGPPSPYATPPRAAQPASPL